jgi:chitodextrinase
MSHVLRFVPLATAASMVVGCTLSDISGPESEAHQPAARPSFSFSLSDYFPPSEASGGWRVGTGAAKVRSLGMDSAAIAAVGAYAMSLPWHSYYTGVSGYNASNKAALIIKDGWIVGEFYNQASARTAVYYLASNGKTFTMMLTGHLALDYPSLNLSGQSLLYDQLWLPEGFPLSDERKAGITFDHVFRHVSGIIPEAENNVAASPLINDPLWNFVPVTVGKDPDLPESAPLYFDPGTPSTYTNGSTYSSVAFNHFSLIFRNITGLEPSLYLRRSILDPIGVGRVAYKVTTGMGGYIWVTAGNALASARDYARLAYLLLHEGSWAGNQIFTAEWIRQFTTVAGYPNISANTSCLWGTQYPKDVYRIIGSGVNIAFVVPSLDLIGALNGRFSNVQKDQISRTFLQKMFAGVTETYVTCDGRTVNPAPTPVPTTIALKVTGRSDSIKQYMTLTWTGARGLTVDVYRNGVYRKNTPNDGKVADSKFFTGPATYIYKVCEAGTYICSNPASVSFEGGLLPPNKAPIPVFTSSCTDLTCSFTDRSVDLDGNLTAWRWSFGDGTSSSDRSPSHPYSAPGTYSVSLTVTDDRGASRSTTAILTVNGSVLSSR